MAEICLTVLCEVLCDTDICVYHKSQYNTQRWAWAAYLNGDGAYRQY